MKFDYDKINLEFIDIFKKYFLIIVLLLCGFIKNVYSLDFVGLTDCSTKLSKAKILSAAKFSNHDRVIEEGKIVSCYRASHSCRKNANYSYLKGYNKSDQLLFFDKRFRGHMTIEVEISSIDKKQNLKKMTFKHDGGNAISVLGSEIKDIQNTDFSFNFLSPKIGKVNLVSGCKKETLDDFKKRHFSEDENKNTEKEGTNLKKTVLEDDKVYQVFYCNPNDDTVFYESEGFISSSHFKERTAKNNCLIANQDFYNDIFKSMNSFSQKFHFVFKKTKLSKFSAIIKKNVCHSCSKKKCENFYMARGIGIGLKVEKYKSFFVLKQRNNASFKLDYYKNSSNDIIINNNTLLFGRATRWDIDLNQSGFDTFEDKFLSNVGFKNGEKCENYAY